MKWTIKEKESGMTIRDYLREVRGLSRRILIAAKSETGKILLNGEEATVRKQLQTGDTLEVKFPPKRPSKWLFPEEIPLDVVYEDAAVLVLNKQAGIPVLPSPLYKSGTIANGVLAHYEKKSHLHTVHIVTRLDKDTSGLLLIAKDRLSHSLLARSQKDFRIKRKYLALVEGNIPEREGVIDAPIGRKPDSIVEREVRPDGKPARTYYQVRERLAGRTLVEIEMETGRTHQIRVHFSHLGHPLLGDDLYGGTNSVMDRQALHCHQLTFEHPYTKEMLSLESSLPDDFLKGCQQ